MSDSREELQRMLAEMRGEYARALPAKLALIESLWREAAGAPATDELLRAVHSLAGGAGTFGMAEVGHAALELEDDLRAGKEPASIDLALERLLQVAHEALSGGDRPVPG
jgi:HPt (histidine-containing phosphotransfer) domain-containing protein